MVSKEEFYSYLDTLFAGEQDNANLKYMKRKQFNLFMFFLIAGIVVAFAGAIVFIVNRGAGLGVFALAGILLFVGIFKRVKISKARKYYVNNYMSKITDYLFDGTKYSFDRNKKIKKSIFKNSGLYGRFDKYYGCDTLRVNIPNDDGSISNNYVTLCDLNVMKTYLDLNRKSFMPQIEQSTVFNGVFGYIDLPFDFNCSLYLNSSSKKIKQKNEVVELEYIEFNNQFTIYSDNQVETRYILDPQMMEKLMKYKEIVKEFAISIDKNRMYIALSNFNLFDLGKLEGEDITSLFKGFYEPIFAVMCIVNEIKQNNKLFKM